MKLKMGLGVFGALLLAAVSANATTISASYSVTTNQGSGLTVESHDAAANPFSFSLNAGESTSFALFDIYTTEGTVNWRDDLKPQPISVDFEFTAPANGSATASGQTVGDWVWILFGTYQGGHVSWDNPTSFQFGPNNDGLLQIALSDAVFNGGFGGTNPGQGAGATINATFTLVHDATPGAANERQELRPTDVPEPSVVLLFGLTLLGMAFVIRRRRRTESF